MARRVDWESFGRLFVFGVLLLVPLLIAAATHGGFLWFAAGAIVWAISVAAKIPLARFLHRGLGESATPEIRGAAHGVLSAACELGCAAACFVWFLTDGSAWTTAAFGAGAGWIEVVALLIPSLRSGDKGPESDELPWHVRWTFLIERTGAVIGHTGSRGLIWLAVIRNPWFALPAGMGFAIVDGLAVYGSIQKWKWLEWETWSRFYGAVTTISMLELLLFIAFAQGM
jgi:hypothetical protein